MFDDRFMLPISEHIGAAGILRVRNILASGPKRRYRGTYDRSTYATGEPTFCLKDPSDCSFTVLSHPEVDLSLLVGYWVL